MSAHKLPGELNNAPFETLDPGTGTAIVVDRWNQIIPLTIAASATETNTLAAPLKAGQKLTLFAASVGSGGKRTVTVASAIDAAGGTTLTFNNVDDRATLESVPVGSGTYEWRVVASEGDVVSRIVAISDADTSILAANSGKPHIIANVSADRTFTLPTPAPGLEFAFYPGLNAADGHDWIFTTGSDTNYFMGGLVHIDTDSDAAGDEVVLVAPNGSSNSKLQINLPQPGTVVRFFCDGTLWTVSGQAVSATAPSFANQ